MRFAITYCKDNIAGKNIVDRFKELGFMPQIPIIKLEKETLYSELSVEKYEELKNVDFLVFSSTHRSEKGMPSLSVHTPGNFRSADLGGEDGKVCMTSAFVCKYLYQKLGELVEENDEIKEKYEVTMEATHHGPLCDIPCCFVELGSKKEDWVDKNAARLLAEVIKSLDEFEIGSKKNDWIPTFGIGGPHYTPNFNEIQMKSKYAIGHVIAEYNFPLTESIVKEAEEKTKEQVKLALIDWKGCGKADDKEQMLKILERLGLSYEKTKKVKGELKS